MIPWYQILPVLYFQIFREEYLKYNNIIIFSNYLLILIRIRRGNFRDNAATFRDSARWIMRITLTLTPLIQTIRVNSVNISVLKGWMERNQEYTREAGINTED